MAYKCDIIADSINPQGDRITSFLVTYPRIIHAEFLRHRMLSRNSASSRAIPFKKMIKQVEEDPFIPIAWQKHHTGMQGSEYIEDDYYPNKHWLIARDEALASAKRLSNNDISKQILNRIIEPYLWHTELITGTEFKNFFELRTGAYEIDLDKLEELSL